VAAALVGDHQQAVWGRFTDVVDEYLKEEGAK